MNEAATPAHYDARETQAPATREADLFARLPGLIAAARGAPGWARHLAGVEASAVTDRAALARLPVLRKPDLLAFQKATPPFGGFALTAPGRAKRIMMSPGPIFEPEGKGDDWWGAARALFAAGIRAGHVVHNAFAYHLTPGGFILESGALALGASVVAAGPGNTEQQVEAIAHIRPDAYVGTPDFLKIVLDKAAELGRDTRSIRHALVSGAALPGSLREELTARGLTLRQCYATADLGVIAYESEAQASPAFDQGMIVNEDLILEVVRPGTGDPVPDGEVGEIVVTRFNPDYPMIRLATGDMTAILTGTSPCGRTNTRIKGWMGRADQTAKIKGMFVHPGQVAEVLRRHPAIQRGRLVIGRSNEQDIMWLKVEAQDAPGLAEAIAESLHSITKLKGAVAVIEPGGLPNDGKVIEDTRPVG
jgi:phenylacetate-CoA ligase